MRDEECMRCLFKPCKNGICQAWAASGRGEPGAGVGPLSDRAVTVQFCTVELSMGSQEQGSEH